MKKYFILSVLLLVSGFFASCNYLNIDDYFEDTFQEDSIYANKRNIERYFNGAAALLPVVDKIWEYGNTPGVTGSDEAVSCGDWNGMVVIQFSGTKLMNNEITSSSMGGWTWDFNIWPKCYKVIRKVRDLFKQAKEKAPCIVFIDEIDAIGKKRDGQIGGNDEREQTLNQLLTEMDGFEGNTGVIILAATNRPESLDPALTRPGRFDRRVPVELPDLKGREEILKVHAKKIRLSDDIDFNKIARMASGASGAELANIVNEAALRAVRDNRRFATQADLEESIETVIAGYQKKNAILTNKEKLIVSYHEIGHALVAAKQNNSAPVQKITIIPRTSGALGYTMQVDEGNHYLMSKEEIENKIATFTGGRAAEEVIFGSVTTGASNDIEQATRLARAMITRYGMNEDFDMVALETVTNQYLGGDASLACSAETQAEIDHKVVELVKQQHQKALQILIENRAKLDELAHFLYDKETITGEEFMNILNA